MTTNERVRKAHERLGLSRKDFAEKMGVSVDTIHSWLRPEGGAAHRPAPEMAAKLAERL